MRRTTMRRLPLVMIAALLLCVGVVGTWAAPAASAHSRLKSSDPADGAKLATAPAQVTLTFNEDLQSSFATLNVVGPDGHYWQQGDPRVDGATISVALRELGPVGEYRINFRVTSGDGHPIEGRRSFELTVAGGGTPGPLAESEQPGSEGDGLSVVPFLVGGALILIVGLGVVFWLGRRKPGSAGKS
ncbi:copper resistance protein CopC [Gordonia sp. ABSL1-1]|uniref:copper resistance CopC family protein n=1 Tax=Gordonia sp. ABSL1-1 TaxID=3053923 RepID=UPI0025734BED|nr:copper resistance CopC family protein [Gordonia sp. ABSL1-1]MDL9936000.1 copper resistance protein CopC [Gordonia sp. ABSL1-1]